MESIALVISIVLSVFSVFFASLSLVINSKEGVREGIDSNLDSILSEIELDIEEIIIETGEVDYPAGVEAGHSISYDTDMLRARLKKILENNLKQTNK